MSTLSRFILLSLCAAFTACQTVGTVSPEQRGPLYAAALREGRMDDAYRLTSASYQHRVDRAAFAARFADGPARQTHAQAVDGALGALAAVAPELSSGSAVQDSSAERARATLWAFASAVQQRRFEVALELLASPLRARYTAETFSRDFDREPLAGERLSRLLAAAARPARSTSEGAVEFPLGAGRAVRLVPESNGMRIQAIE